LSINLCLRGTREILVIKTSETEIQGIGFELEQTPSAVTRMIMESSDRKAAYIEFCREDEFIETVDVYDENDVFNEDPIGFELVNRTEEHIQELEDFIELNETEGYEFEFYAQ